LRWFARSLATSSALAPAAGDASAAHCSDSVSSAVLHHSPVPVVVLHPPHKPREAG
jgi:hypothetical protein